MPASADYLTKYLTASNDNSSPGDFEDSSRPKKRRKKDKHATSSSTLLIADDDDGLLLANQKKKGPLDDDEENPLVYATKQRSAEFRKKKSSAWQQVDDEDVPRPTNDNAQPSNNDDAEADAILNAAAAESAVRRAEIDREDQPTVVDNGTTQDDEPRMSSGAKAGLQTVQDTAAILAREAAEEEQAERAKRKKKSSKSQSQDDPNPSQDQETIYRDATGRRIDVTLKRAELRAAEQAKLAAEKKAREAAMGDVQLQQKQQAKEDLENAKFLTLGRSADDEELNEAQKEELRWEDPMAAYMAERAREAEREEDERLEKSGGRESRRKGKDVELVKKPKKKEYAGAAPPNRYGIKPGWRWDGVDRGNGFEKEWFQARGKKARNESLEYQWAMDE